MFAVEPGAIECDEDLFELVEACLDKQVDELDHLGLLAMAVESSIFPQLMFYEKDGDEDNVG